MSENNLNKHVRQRFPCFSTEVVNRFAEMHSGFFLSPSLPLSFKVISTLLTFALYMTTHILHIITLTFVAVK